MYAKIVTTALHLFKGSSVGELIKWIRVALDNEIPCSHKKNEVAICILIWKINYNILLKKKYMSQKNICGIKLFFGKHNI